jgi:hypothetical protein
MKDNRRSFLKFSAMTTTAGFLPWAGLAATEESASRSVARGGGESRTLPGTSVSIAEECAKRHLMTRELPSPNFFEGMLLGNGDVGVCVVVRPDALGLHLGKSDVWDIRVSEEEYKKLLPFADLLKLWERAGEEAKRRGKQDMLFLETSIDFFREYTQSTMATYERSWPRPWPCGTIWIHWDSRWLRVRRQDLDPSNGLFTLWLDCREPGKPHRELKVSCFVDWETGLISVSTEAVAPFFSVVYLPKLDDQGASSEPLPAGTTRWGLLPPPEIEGKVDNRFAEFSCYQWLPATAPSSKMPNSPHSHLDRSFALYAQVAGSWTLSGLEESQKRLRQHGQISETSSSDENIEPGIYLQSTQEQILRMDLEVVTPRDVLLRALEREAAAAEEKKPWVMISQDHSYEAECAQTLPQARQDVERMAHLQVRQIRKGSEAKWKEFWSHSAVVFEDRELERIWYHNQYFLACCLRARKTAPGLFGNWTTGNLGTAWHGEYCLDYNEQQIYWGVFSSNHVEQHLPYVEICLNLLGIGETFARENMGYPGIYCNSATFPVPSQTFAPIIPPYAYQISSTPWTVQSLWWHYLYTQDMDYLRRVYPVLRAAAQFLAAYPKKGADGKYHIIPTVSPENWGLTVDYRLNKDCILDLALTKFVLDAAGQAAQILAQDEDARSQWAEVGANLAPYPKCKGPYGEVWADVRDAPVEHVYNIPVTLGPVFPAEQVGIGRHEEQLEIGRRSAATVRLRGGNDLVYQPLILARLGMLDLKWFKNQVAYCLLPNGTAGDRVRQMDGGYTDSTDFDFMMHMGVWTENLSLPAVLNECLLQSYTGTIRLFPNTQNLGPAKFVNLRAAGAFLVSASYDGKTISEISLHSERGMTVRLANPWQAAEVHVARVRDGHSVAVRGESGIVIFPTDAGETYRFEKA